MPTPFDLRSHGYNLVPGDAISVREDREGGLEQTFWLRVKCFNPKVYKETECKEPGGLAVRMVHRVNARFTPYTSDITKFHSGQHWSLSFVLRAHAIVRIIQLASSRKTDSLTIFPSSRASKRQMCEPFTSASSLVGVGWCDRTSSFCSW